MLDTVTETALTEMICRGRSRSRLVSAGDGRILGAHVIGPQAAVLIQEIVTLMYTAEQSLDTIFRGMHIHPALSEAVERAAQSLMPAARYDAR